jgi:predicted PurR-regulated permease PerM
MQNTERVAHFAVIFIAGVLMVAAMSLAKDILAPITMALIAGVVLSPLSDFWEGHGYSPVWGALVGLLVTLILVGALVLAFQPVIAGLVEQAPKVWSDMQDVVRSIRGILRGLSDVSANVATAITPEAQASTDAAPQASMAMPSVSDAILAAPAILSQILIFAGSLFFFLLTRREIYEWISLRLSSRGERAELSLRLRRAERNVSRYFVTITLINAALGALTALALEMMGVSDAMIWGLVAFMVNFVVYLGPTVFLVVLLFVGIAQFDGPMSLAPAAAFLTLNTLEGQFFTPTLVGKHMSVNPLLIFLALIFGIWLWGPIGGIVAIPMLLWVLVLSDVMQDPRKATAQDIAA